MKRCSCEHWQICPTCYPQGFDEHGVRKPVEFPPSREELQRQAVALREQVEKLKNRLNKDSQEFTILCAKETEKVLREQLAALAEQVEKLTKERDEYKSGFEAAASKYRNLKLQMQEIINVC